MQTRRRAHVVRAQALARAQLDGLCRPHGRPHRAARGPGALPPHQRQPGADDCAGGRRCRARRHRRCARSSTMTAMAGRSGLHLRKVGCRLQRTSPSARTSRGGTTVGATCCRPRRRAERRRDSRSQLRWMVVLDEQSTSRSGQSRPTENLFPARRLPDWRRDMTCTNATRDL